MHHKLDGVAKRGLESMVVVYSVPTAPGYCRLINRNMFRFTKTKLPAAILRMLPGWLSHVGSHVPLEDDQIFLHYGEARAVTEIMAGTWCHEHEASKGVS